MTRKKHINNFLASTQSRDNPANMFMFMCFLLQNGPAEVQCEFFSPSSGVKFLMWILGGEFFGRWIFERALFIGKHRTRKCDPRIRPQYSGLKNLHPRIRPRNRVHEVQDPLCGNLPLSFFLALRTTLRAKGALISEPRFSTPCEMRFFPREKGKMDFVEGFSLKMAFSLSRVGKIASRRG